MIEGKVHVTDETFCGQFYAGNMRFNRDSEHGMKAEKWFTQVFLISKGKKKSVS